jgi:hypothetical protein
MKKAARSFLIYSLAIKIAVRFRVNECSAFLLHQRPSHALYESLHTRRLNTPDDSSTNSNGSGEKDGIKMKRAAQIDAVVSPKKEIVKKRKDGEAASAAMDLPVQPLVKTIPGGTRLIFEAARQSVPRWHPTAGVADVNPNFRTEPPMMNSQGYAASIRRNARKRQSAMWRYAIRTYDRLMEQHQSSTGPRTEVSTVHLEGALTAAAKLGWSERALQVYQWAEQREEQIRDRLQPSIKRKSIGVQVTENMVLSVIRACVRQAGRIKSREPLDAARRLVETVEAKHDIPVTAIHLNPIAAAYQSLGLLNEANELLQENLGDRVGGPEAENDLENSFNVYDVQSKDKGSYSLLVSAAVSEQDWAGAVEALRTMTEAGLYPANRHLNTWTEISVKKRNSRMVDSRSSASKPARRKVEEKVQTPKQEQPLQGDGEP